jgi:hypothetical protein
VSQIIADKVRTVARNEAELTSGTREFVEAYGDSVNQQQMLPLWH